MQILLFFIFIVLAFCGLYFKIRNLKYEVFEKLSTPVCILNKYDNVVFLNSAYRNFIKQFCLNNEVNLFAIFANDQLATQKLYLSKNLLLKQGYAKTTLFYNNIYGQQASLVVLANKFSKNTIWILSDIDQNSFANKDQIDSSRIYYLFDKIPVPLVAVNKTGKIEIFNKEFLRLTRIKENEAKNSLLQDYIVGEDRGFLESLLNSSKSSGVIHNHYIDVTIRPNNKIIRIIAQPLDDDVIAKAKQLFSLALIEVTKQKALEEEIGHSKKMQAVGQLAGGIAHDFNNILTGIIMSCDFLLNSHRSSDPSHPDLLTIKQNATRASALVQQLLAFSRKQTLKISACNIADIIADTVPLLNRLLTNNIRLQIKNSHDLYDAMVDKSSFQQVLLNLIINAKDAIGEKAGLISIEVENKDGNQIKKYVADAPSDGNFILLSINDNGCGMNEETKDKIFDPFFTTKDVGKGTGLGLSMVYGIIKQTGGWIECSSTQGVGTSFYIILPACDQKDQPLINIALDENKKAIILKDQNNQDLSGNQTILIVDDEFVVRKGFVRALESRGYLILEAESGEQAIDLYKKNCKNINLIICDVLMPELDGVQVYKAVRKEGYLQKFAFISGFTKEAFEEKYNLTDKEFEFLNKPISVKELLSRVKEILQ